MSTIVVSFGRNVGTRHPHPTLSPGAELDVNEWGHFVTEARDLITGSGFEIVFAGTGQGVYEGSRETSYTMVTTADEAVTADEFDELCDRFALLAFRYYQDSIAVTVGSTRFAAVAA